MKPLSYNSSSVEEINLTNGSMTKLYSSGLSLLSFNSASGSPSKDSKTWKLDQNAPSTLQGEKTRSSGIEKTLLMSQLFTDVNNLKNKLKDQFPQSDATVLQIMAKRATICITFSGMPREATPEEFKLLKIFAIEEGYDFEEETDTTPESNLLYYYILSAADSPL